MGRRVTSTVDKNYNYLIGETDAQVWVDAWLEIIAENPSIPTDPGTMLGWFANAIQSGIMSVKNEGVLEDFLARLEEEPDDPVIAEPQTVRMPTRADVLDDFILENGGSRSDAVRYLFGD
jgi:hypothetical protein